MIRYVGGKTRLAKEIAAIIQQHIKPVHTEYYEPFFGGGSMAQYTKHFGLQRVALDIHCGLINLYKMLDMWKDTDMIEKRLKNIDEAEYNRLKQLTEPDLVQSARKAYAGFGLSFGGKWFGGYARDRKGNRDFADESYRRLIKHIPDIEGIHFHCMDYRYLFPVTETSIIYADPPYANTLGYRTGRFDTTSFWETIRQWSNNGAVVIVSEYEAPDDFVSIWEKPRKIYMHHKATNKENVERLFMYNMKGT